MVMANGSSSELHVLAVDDSLVERMLIERLLKSFSCKVTVVDSGRRALQILGLDVDDEKKSSVGLDALKVNLIMTDYSMPGMTGYELLKKIKESSAFREVPVVIMSSERVLARINRCLEEGAEDFLAKPVKPSDVKRLKESLIRGGDLDKNRSGTKKRLRDNDHVVSEQSASLSPTHTCNLSQSESIVGVDHVASSMTTLLYNTLGCDQDQDQSVRGDADHAILEQPSSLALTCSCALGQSESMLEDDHVTSSEMNSLLQNTLGCDRDQEQSLRESASSLSSTYSSLQLVAHSSKRLKMPGTN